MKRPRVFIKQGYFWLQYYVPGREDHIRRSTGVVADITFTKGNPDWWKKSKHAAKIRASIEQIETDRRLSGIGMSSVTRKPSRKVPGLLAVVAELNNESSAEGPLSDQTIKRRVNSANTLLRYDHRLSIAREFTKEWVADLRRWMKAQKFTEWTQYTLLQDLKLFVKFATSKRYTDRNTLADMRFTQPESSTEHTPRSEEFKLFTWLYHHNPKYFLAFITQRLAGYRISDVITIERSQLDLKNNLFRNVLNVKGHRPEVFPISDALAYVYDNMQHEFGIAFPFPSSYRYAMDVLQEGCKKLEIRKIPTHQFKRNYSGEIEDIETLTHIFDMLMHHKTKSVAGRSYTGKNIELMRGALNKAQPHWMAFVKKLVIKTGTKQGLK